MDEARIKVSPTLSIVLPAQVPERVNPMRMIEMRVDAENLTKACAAVVEERFRKACALANPIATVSIYGAGRVRTRRSRRSLSRECFGVVDLAIHPPLDEVDILRCRHWYRIFLVVQPGIRVAVEGQKKYYLLIGHRIIPPSSSHFRAGVGIAYWFSSVVVCLLDALSNGRDNAVVLNGCTTMY